MTQIIGQGATATTLNAGTITTGSVTGTSYGGMQAPDVVGNIRVDQTWGSAQVMAAAHEVNPLYYGTTAITGHPSDQWGFAAGAGLRLNFPMVAQGDYFQGEVNYSQGAMRYPNDVDTTNFDASMGNNQVFGIQSDCVYGGVAGTTGTGCNLTTAWSVNASYEHFWTPSVHQSLVGAYISTTYNTQANAILCSLSGAANGAGIGSAATATAGCNMNWQMYGVSSRLQWDVTKTFYLGVEVLYDHMNSASTADGLTHGFGLGGVDPPASVSSGMDTWAVTARMHKDFLP